MILGIIGDDFTGSSDIENNLKKTNYFWIIRPTLFCTKSAEKRTTTTIVAQNFAKK